MESKLITGRYDWQQAIACQGDGWRLPSIFELLYLCEENTEDTINGYWSASPYAGYAAVAWYVYFGSGGGSVDSKTSTYYVRLVRGEPVVCDPVTDRAIIAYTPKPQNTKEKPKMNTEERQAILNAIEVKRDTVSTFTLGELYDFGVGAGNIRHLVREHTKEALLCGYTKDQWEYIMKHKFICAFSNTRETVLEPYSSGDFGRLMNVNSSAREPFSSSSAILLYKYCAPIRQVGTRQPWFGGEQPVPDAAKVLVKWRDGNIGHGTASRYDWGHANVFDDIIEFVYLETSDAESRILEGEYTWQQAIDAQGNGWHLPSIFELLDLYEENTEDTTKGFWSASPYSGDERGAWNVNFSSRGSHGANPKTITNSVHMVLGDPVECKPVTTKEVRAYKEQQQRQRQRGKDCA